MTETRGRRIFHLLAASAWDAEAGSGAPLASDQLQRHGFVHCCTREQILEIATWWLGGEGPLAALEIDADLAGDVRFERADLGRMYPHVYNAIPRAALITTHRLLQVGDTVSLPPALGDPPAEFVVSGTLGGKGVVVRWRGGAFVEGDAGVIAAAETKVAAGDDVPQFPGVTRPASSATAYDAFCLLAAVLDEISDYRGDGFFADADP